ncbi:hypothetical protein F4561_002612 [Lipingzhangella halophila]|uniref:AAA+ ATPase domain-containing protein n=1 Tax=Lipingzhangella halophila TaxID=1783352 RepID=A0A7W7RH66_9ACTN|nr:ATP-binding protein [Lipingzhangella halophila]MBB4931792.1 hypothetical protein [Lipingzhangella halophila]
MTDFTFEDATPEAEKARIALQGPSGSGKTWTALRLAKGLSGTVGVIDTERGSASKYGRNFEFKTLKLPHYDPDHLIRALGKAAEAGIDVLIVDSLSQFWSGQGGILSKVDEAARRSGGGNSFAGWKDVRPIEARMLEALLSYPGHVIATMRVKTEWAVQDNDRGKKAPVKIGLKPEQREGLDYEFDVVGELDLSHTLVVSKSRVSDLAVGEVVSEPGEDLGERIGSWLGQGTPAANATEYRDRALEKNATKDDLRKLHKEAQQRRLLGAAVVNENGDVESLEALIVRRGAQAPEAPAGPSGVAA